MKTYIIAYISFFDNDLKLKQVVAESELKAGIAFLLNEQLIDKDDIVVNMEQLKQFAFDCDSMIEVKEGTLV